MPKLSRLPAAHVAIDMGDEYKDFEADQSAVVYVHADFSADAAEALYQAAYAANVAAMSTEEYAAHLDTLYPALDLAIAEMVVGTNIAGLGATQADALAMMRQGDREQQNIYWFLLRAVVRHYEGVVSAYAKKKMNSHNGGRDTPA